MAAHLHPLYVIHLLPPHAFLSSLSLTVMRDFYSACSQSDSPCLFSPSGQASIHGGVVVRKLLGHLNWLFRLLVQTAHNTDTTEDEMLLTKIVPAQMQALGIHAVMAVQTLKATTKSSWLPHQILDTAWYNRAVKSEYL